MGIENQMTNEPIYHETGNDRAAKHGIFLYMDIQVVMMAMYSVKNVAMHSEQNVMKSVNTNDGSMKCLKSKNETSSTKSDPET